MRRSRIPQLSVAGFLIAGALLIVAGGMLYRQMRESQYAHTRVVKTLLIRAQIRSLHVSLDDAETGQRGFLLTGDPSYLQPYEKAVAQLPRQIEILQQLTQDDGAQQNSLAQIKPLITEKMGELAESIEARRQGGFPAGLRIVISNHGKHLMDRMRAILASMQRQEVNRYVDSENVSDRLTRSLSEWVFASLSLAFLLVLGSGLWLARQYRLLERTEDALEQSEARFRRLVDGVQDYAIIALDASGCVASWNRGAERINGYPADEIIGQHFSRFYPDAEEAAGKPAELLRLASAKGQATVEGWRVRKDGSKFWASVLITALRDAQGQLTGYSKITRDLTGRKQADDALRASEQRFRAVAESAHEAILSTDQEGKIVYWNPEAESVFGYPATEVLGLPATVLIPAHLHDDYEQGRRRLLNNRVARLLRGKIQTVGRKKDGSEFPLELSLASWESSEGIFFTAIMSDISERLRKERVLRESGESLRQLSSLLFNVQDEERRRLSRDLHDNAGQYLVMLKMRLDSLESSGGLPDKARQHVSECAHLADQSIREIRTKSYEMYPPMLEEVGLKSAIPWYLEGFSERSGITATLDMPEDLSRPPLDVELALFRVLQESLSNVRRHSGSPSAHVRMQNHGETIQLEVSDCGKGVPREILDAFNREYLGKLGIGLRGMKERIRQIGGRMEVSSNGAGTAVRATVPVARPEVRAAAGSVQRPV